MKENREAPFLGPRAACIDQIALRYLYPVEHSCHADPATEGSTSSLAFSSASDQMMPCIAGPRAVCVIPLRSLLRLEFSVCFGRCRCASDEGVPYRSRARPARQLTYRPNPSEVNIDFYL